MRKSVPVDVDGVGAVAGRGAGAEVAEHVHRLGVTDGYEGAVHGVVVVVERIAVRGAVEQEVRAPGPAPVEAARHVHPAERVAAVAAPERRQAGRQDQGAVG